LLRADLCAEAIRLGRLLIALLPNPDSEVEGLLALMLLQHSRRDARVDEAGRIVLLPDQDRSRWHRDEVVEAVRLLRSPCLTGPITVQAAGYAVQARIAVEHATAPTAEATEWDRVVAHYDDLVALSPTPSARLARAVAVAEARGPDEGLAALAGLDDELSHSHRLPAVRAELLTRAGDREGADAAYAIAIERCGNDAERALLLERRAAIVGSGTRNSRAMSWVLTPSTSRSASALAAAGSSAGWVHMRTSRSRSSSTRSPVSTRTAASSRPDCSTTSRGTLRCAIASARSRSSTRRRAAV
jgi:predicted RNA polymerase sigma factor